MKKLLILSLLAFTFSNLKAQSPSFGIKAGSNFSNLNLIDGDNSYYITGLNLGALAHVHLSRQWALQPEIFYSGQGGEFRTGSTINKYVLSYVNVPLLIQYMFDNGFRLQAGPQLGFLVNAKNKGNNQETNLKNNYNSTDVSFPIGMGYLFDSGFGIDGRWVPGVSNIQKSGNETANNVFQIGLFYQFNNHK